MKASKALLTLLAAALALSLAEPAPGAGFTDVLDTPAQMSPLAGRSLLQGVARAGNRLIAVGQRGTVVVSNDNGATWKQSPIPVSSDLTAVYFPDDRQGWAVGHDGVVLHTSDGGDSWQLQLEGRKVNDLLVAAMERRLAAEPASATVKALLTEAQRYKEQGADKPFLDVWFSDAKNGYVVGAYNLIFRTEDGGATWESLFDRTDNPKFFNLYAIRPAANELYIVGESGLVLKLDPASKRFVALSVPYNGSFFGVAGAGSAVLVYGLRGNVYRSDDAGKTWAKADAGLPAAIVSSAPAGDGAILLADGGGRIAASADGGRTFNKVALKNPMPITAFAPVGNERFVLVGPRGATVTEVAAR